MQNSLKSDKIAYAILQRKLKEYINLESEKEAPIIRFEGFSDAWELRKLGEIADVTKLAGFEFTKYVSYKETGEIIALRGLNVKNGRLVLNDVKYIDESDFSKLNRSKLYKNDILFTYVGTVGELAIVQEDDKYYLAPNVARIRINSDATPIFVTQMMNDSNFYRRIIFPLIATSSQPALSMENVRKFDLIMPVELEQQKIGLFFQHLDNTITLHQRKLDKLKQLKQGYLQQLFPRNDEKVPRVRFENLGEEWKLCKFSKVLKTHPFRQYLAKSIEDGRYEIIQQGDKPIIGYANGIPFQNFEDVSLFGDHTVSLYKPTNPFFVATDGVKILSGEDFNGKYLFTILERYKPESQGYKRHFTILKNQDVCYTQNSKEQTEIGELFNQLDNIITLHQSKLDKLKLLKQALLQKMFI